ncbi:MAG: hypothetical protein KVP17_002725 [Porospora cf. gigantea B]|nr:MAG: hypothetical protein KVP17_002725 [Porospora cf. gigantea B]
MSIVFQDTLKQLEKLQMFSLLGWELNRQPISEGVSVGYCFPADFTNTTCEYDGVASWSVDLSQCPKTFVTPITPEFFQAADATTSGYFTVCMVVVVGPFFVALLILGVARSFKSF